MVSSQPNAKNGVPAIKLSLIALAIAFALTGFQGSANAQASSDTSGKVAGQAKSGEPSTGAGSVQLPSPNSEDQGGTGVKGSAQGEGATNKDTAPRDTMPR
jgi:hypothetical protein